MVPPVPDGVHGRGVLGVPGALDAGGLDLGLLEGRAVDLGLLLGVYAGPPQLPHEEQGDDEAARDEELADTVDDRV